MKNFSQQPLEDKDCEQRHEAVGQDQNGNGVHASANGVLKVEQKIGDVADGGLEKIRQFFKNGLILRAAVHGLVELVGAVLRLLDGFLDIRGKIGGDDVGDMGAAWNDKGRRQTQNADPSRQTLQEVSSGSDKQNPHKAGQWDEDHKRRLDPVLDQNFFQEQDGEDSYKIDIHVCQAVRQRGREVIR